MQFPSQHFGMEQYKVTVTKRNCIFLLHSTGRHRIEMNVSSKHYVFPSFFFGHLPVRDMPPPSHRGDPEYPLSSTIRDCWQKRIQTRHNERRKIKHLRLSTSMILEIVWFRSFWFYSDWNWQLWKKGLDSNCKVSLICIIFDTRIYENSYLIRIIKTFLSDSLNIQCSL